jgi:hypothetical protein
MMCLSPIFVFAPFYATATARAQNPPNPHKARRAGCGFPKHGKKCAIWHLIPEKNVKINN